MSSLYSSSRHRALLPRLRAILTFQRYEHTTGNVGEHGELCTEMGSGSLIQLDNMKFGNWKKLDSRTLGIKPSMISGASWTVVKILQREGYEAYLVGGCVRDLILKRIPKDFDVITTAALPKIRKTFRRSIIIGRRFPICKVFIGGSFVEVSSFDTAAEQRDTKNEILTSRMPAGYDERDILRWRNCMERDFTINSLFYDPFVNKIYDYSNSLRDLKSLKLKTLLPAHVSFEEDCARILRGLRLAARLNMSFAGETETAVQKLSSSVLSLNKSRLFMEVNYMLSYGAAERSLCLLKRYHLLEFLFPIQNAYVTEQSCVDSEHDSMLMKLFSNLDLLVSCDRPSDSALWLAILVFHMALVKNPQHSLVVLAFASLLYHGNWEDGISYARGHIDAALRYDTELSDCSNLSDDELSERVAGFSALVKYFINVVTDSNSLKNAILDFHGLTCSGLVFVSQRMGERVEQVFDTLVKDGASVTSLNMKRKNFKIDYGSLGSGDIRETSFVLGKIIIETMIPGGISCKEQKGKDDSEEINPLPEIELTGDEKSIGLPSQNLCSTLHDILEMCQSPQDEFQAILGDVIHESIKDDGTRKADLNNDKKFQLSARKRLKMLEKGNDVLVRKKRASMQEHNFVDEGVEENKIVVGGDKSNLDKKRRTSERNAEQNLRKGEMKKVLTKLGRKKRVELNHDKNNLSKMMDKCHGLLERMKGTPIEENYFPEKESVEENKIVIDRDAPNLDRNGLTSEQNADNLKIVESKKVLTRLGGRKKEEPIHDARFQLPTNNPSEMLEECKKEHHFPEEELVGENNVVVDRDEPNLDCGLTYEENAQHNTENGKSKKALTRLYRLF